MSDTPQDYALPRSVVSFTPREIVKYVMKRELATAQRKVAPVARDLSPIPFPTWVMDGFAKEIAVTYSQSLETRETAFYMAALTCLGSMITGSVRLNTILKTDPRLYTILIGDSGDAHKSTAAIKMIEFFRDNFKAFKSTQGAGSAEGLFNEINRERWDQRLLLYYDEFQTFVNKCRIDSSVLLQIVNTLFESNKWESPLKNSRMKLDSAHLCFLSASTEETYDECWTSTFTNIGFNNRLFIVPITSTEKRSLPPAIPAERIEELRQMVESILALVADGRTYDMTPEAFQLYDEWYKGFEGDKSTVRVTGYALRLMVLLAANELKTEIDEEIAKKVLAICEWQVRVRRRYLTTPTDNPYAAIEAKIRRVLTEGSMSQRKIYWRTNASRVGIKMFQAALDNMMRIGEIYRDTTGNYSLSKNW